jgi:adenine deaminase
MMNSFSLTGRIVDVVAGRIFPGKVTIGDGKIVSVEPADAVDNQYVLPGLIDSHVHIESSMLIPVEFARLAVVHGTVATVSDPHEIANVLGAEGVDFMIENGRLTPFKFHFGAPSCVPATGFESSGSVIGPEQIDKMLGRDDIYYLSEMMNFPGVIYGDPEVDQKLSLAKKHKKPVDGHAPGLDSDGIRKYASAGISTDHECVTIEEAIEKIRCGMHILIREGSAAKNFETLIPLIEKFPGKVMFCSDDKHPDDLVAGHINLLVKRAIKAGYNPLTVIRACTLNPVKHYNLTCGLLQPGDRADIITVDNLSEFNITRTFIDGELVSSGGKSLIGSYGHASPNHFSASTVTPADIEVTPTGNRIKVIQAYDGSLMTGKLLATPLLKDDKIISDVRNDILKMTVINRYKPSKPAVAFIRGFGLKKGAMASTVAHDSHNIICVGTSDEYMVSVINSLVENKGGIAVTDGINLEVLPLPVAGLMSGENGYAVAEKYQAINEKAFTLGGYLSAPFMTLSFMALLVIPELKLSDKGLFDGLKFAFTDLFEEKSPET